jgi:hypothetical protein
LIVDYKHQDYRHPIHRNNRRSGKKPPLEQKNPNRRWPILECIALSTKILHIADVFCRLLFDNPVT